MSRSKTAALGVGTFISVLLLLDYLLLHDPEWGKDSFQGFGLYPRPARILDKRRNFYNKNDPVGDGEHILNIVNTIENKKPLLVTLINNAYLPFAYSWLCNTKHMDIHKQVLLITTDKETEENLKKHWPEVKVVLVVALSVSGDQVYSHAGYVRLMIRRTQILLELLNNHIEIFLFEVDCLWIKNPVPVLNKYTTYDILVNPVSDRPGVIAGGFLYLFPTKTTKLLWSELNKKLLNLEKKIQNLPSGTRISEGDNDQMYLSNLVAIKYGGLKTKTLPLNAFADGKWYALTDAQRASVDPYVINNNWIIGNQNKISRAKTWGHWFLKGDNWCDMQQVEKIVKLF